MYGIFELLLNRLFYGKYTQDLQIKNWDTT